MPSAGELKLKIQSARRKGKYPEWLRREVGDLVASRRRTGQTLKSLSKELGAGVSTLARWQSEAADVATTVGGELVPVRVHAVPVVPESNRSPQMVTVVSPAGWRIEGVPFDQAWQAVSGQWR